MSHESNILAFPIESCRPPIAGGPLGAGAWERVQGKWVWVCREGCAECDRCCFIAKAILAEMEQDPRSPTDDFQLTASMLRAICRR